MQIMMMGAHRLIIPASRLLWAGTLLAGALLAGCSTVPVAPVGGGVRGEVAHTAYDMLGTPYRYGGDTPRGFDCSGLVYYAYRRAGVTVPRDTVQQFRHTRTVSLRHLRPGDLLFFRLAGRRVSHVGIYIGDGKFIHAPPKGSRSPSRACTIPIGAGTSCAPGVFTDAAARVKIAVS